MKEHSTNIKTLDKVGIVCIGLPASGVKSAIECRICPSIYRYEPESLIWKCQGECGSELNAAVVQILILKYRQGLMSLEFNLNELASQSMPYDDQEIPKRTTWWKQILRRILIWIS